MLTKKDKDYLKQLLNNEKIYYSSELKSDLEIVEYNKSKSIRDSIAENKKMIEYIKSLILKLS